MCEYGLGKAYAARRAKYALKTIASYLWRFLLIPP